MQINKKVISVWSPVGGLGGSFASINIAKRLSEQGSALLIDFDLKTPSIALYSKSENVIHSIDNILPFTNGPALDVKVLENNLQDFLGYRYLRGTSNPDQSLYIKIESAAQIIDAAKEKFEYIVIDCNSSIDNVGTYTALECSDIVVTLIDKNVINIQSLERMKSLLSSSFDFKKFNLVINKETKGIHMLKEDIENYLGMTAVGEIALIDNLSLTNSINQGKLEDFVKNKQMAKYNQDIARLCEKITSTDGEFASIKESSFGIRKQRRR